MQKIVVICDRFTSDDFSGLTDTVAGWADIQRIPEVRSMPSREVLEADVIVGWASPQELLAGRAKVYLCGSAGLDAYIGIGLEKKPGFRICNAADLMSESIAEHLLALMLAFSRDLPQIQRQQQGQVWERRWGSKELRGTTVCLVGLGNSGSALAKKCAALGMRVVGVRRSNRRDHPHVPTVYPAEEILGAVADADHVVAVIPGGAATKHLFNEEFFSRMKPGSFFYSASRGSVTDENALLSSLKSGHLGGAGLDVFAQEPLPAGHPFWNLPNVIVSPHSAGLSCRLFERLAGLMRTNLDHLRHGRPLLNEVDLAQAVISTP